MVTLVDRNPPRTEFRSGFSDDLNRTAVISYNSDPRRRWKRARLQNERLQVRILSDQLAKLRSDKPTLKLRETNKGDTDPEYNTKSTGNVSNRRDSGSVGGLN